MQTKHIAMKYRVKNQKPTKPFGSALAPKPINIQKKQNDMLSHFSISVPTFASRKEITL
jgi:hypothetical protein